MIASSTLKQHVRGLGFRGRELGFYLAIGNEEVDSNDRVGQGRDTFGRHIDSI